MFYLSNANRTLYELDVDMGSCSQALLNLKAMFSASLRTTIIIIIHYYIHSYVPGVTIDPAIGYLY